MRELALLGVFFLILALEGCGLIERIEGSLSPKDCAAAQILVQQVCPQPGTAASP